MDREILGAIRDVAHEVGVDIADALVREFGGTQIYVPKHIKDHQILVKKLGRDQVERLTSKFSCQKLDIPMHLYDEAAARRELILKMFAKRIKIAKIARKAHCTERFVYMVLQQHNDSTPSLF